MSKKPQISKLRLLILAPSHQPSKGQSPEPDSSLVLAAPLFTSFLVALTNSSPSKDLATFAGYTTHPPLSLKTKYYSADVNLWCDELPAASDTDGSISDLSQWKEQMLSTEAAEVRDVIGGIIILLPFNAAIELHGGRTSNESAIEYILAASELRDCIEDETGRDTATVAIIQDLTPLATIEKSSIQDHNETLNAFAQHLEDQCLSEHGIFGWDIVALQCGSNRSDVNAEDEQVVNTKKGSQRDKNEFGEKTGIARVIDVLEQIDWLSSTQGEASQSAGFDLVSTDEFLEDDDGFLMPTVKPKINIYGGTGQDPVQIQSEEFQAEGMSLHSALREQEHHKLSNINDNEDIQVEQLGNLMQRVVAIREAASEMSGPAREAFARREIRKIMQEIDVD